jgi:rubredoxin
MNTHLKKYFLIFCIIFSQSAFAQFLVVTPDQVSITADGIFISLNGITAEVESINSANNGYIVAIPTPQTGICPSCGSSKYVDGRFCPVCGFPDDSKKALKP